VCQTSLFERVAPRGWRDQPPLVEIRQQIAHDPIEEGDLVE
jgi:hypothetical protein